MHGSRLLVLLAANALSLGRLLVGLAFPWIGAGPRPWVFLVAAASDGIDGAISRQFNAASTAGRLLDPIADKVFVLMVIATLWSESAIALWQIALVGMRDWVVLLVGVWLLVARRWDGLRRMAPRLSGKIATCCQFVYLLALLCDSAYVGKIFVATVLASSLAAVHYLAIALDAARRAGGGTDSRPVSFPAP